MPLPSASPWSPLAIKSPRCVPGHCEWACVTIFEFLLRSTRSPLVFQVETHSKKGWKMGEDGMVYRRNFGRGRGLLKLGTALGGVAALALPSMAHAAITLSPYRITAPTLVKASKPFATPIAHLSKEFISSQELVSDPHPQDLTIQKLALAPMSRAMAAAAGDVTYNGGDISKTGDLTPGIYTNSLGATTITANSVTTSGYAAPGIIAIGNGAISINVGSVQTQGDLSPGIFAYSYTGAININAGSVSTAGLLSRGIEAHGSDVTITAGSVTTTGLVSDGILAFGNGPDAVVDVTVNGQVATTGTLSLGVSARSTGSVAIHDNGSITTQGQGVVYHRLVGLAIGIFGYAAGDITIDGTGSVATYGFESRGVQAVSTGGNISIDIGNITTTGWISEGNFAEAVAYDYYAHHNIGTGDISITAGKIDVKGQYSSGIGAVGRSVDITVNGSVVAEGAVGSGIAAAGYGGGVSIHNNGVVATYANGTAIFAKTYSGDITIDGTGRIIAQGGGATGIEALSVDGSISISQGDITSNRTGVLALALPSSGMGDPSRSIDISVGNVR